MCKGGNKLLYKSKHPGQIALLERSLKLLYGFGKHVIIGVDRLHYGDLVVGRTVNVLIRHAYFLKQLFSRTKPGVNYLYINIGLKSGKTDKIARKVAYFYRLTHVKHEYLAARCHGTCLEHKLDRLGNGHKITAHIRVGYRNGAALGDLLAEKGHNAAV